MILRADAGRVDSLSWKLCLTLLSLACATFLLLLVGWFRALVVSGETNTTITAVRQEVDIPMPSIVNPLHVTPGNDERETVASHTWQRVTIIDGKYQWFCEQTGIFATDDELHNGALTTEGYEMCREGDEHWWYDSNTNETRWRAPWEVEEHEKAAEILPEAAIEIPVEVPPTPSTRRYTPEGKPILWRRVIERNVFFWFCDYTREIALTDSALPHGAVSIDGWEYFHFCSTTSTASKPFWSNMKTQEKQEEGPWVEDEMEVLYLTTGWPRSF